jgi:hypothetical protein
LLASADTAYNAGSPFDLFNDDADTVLLQKKNWGIYNVCVVEAFRQKDTVYKTFTMANKVDSATWAALYLADNDYPLSLSGKTSIVGTAYLPKGGVLQAFVDNKSYLGDKNLITGKKFTSAKDLPTPDTAALTRLYNFFSGHNKGDSTMGKDSLFVSHRVPTRFLNFGKRPAKLSNTYLEGNIVIQSDTTLFIDSSARLENVIVFAKGIKVQNGFKGKCQLFAQDSIHVAGNCTFLYPSVLGLISMATDKNTVRKIHVDSSMVFAGIIFTWQKNKNEVSPIIEIGKNIKIRGQVYAQGGIKFNDASSIAGSVFSKDFLYKKALTLYRGYLVDATINSTLLSPYYLTSGLFPASSKQKMVLQWLESN